MIEYKPKAPNELADKQLKREKYESEKVKPQQNITTVKKKYRQSRCG